MRLGDFRGCKYELTQLNFRFRWASLTMDSLGEMGTIQKIKEALESLPNGLDEIYTRSLDEINHHKSDAIRILQFLLFSPIPLTVEDVLEATSVNLEAPPGCEIDPLRRMNSFDKLSSLMSTFIRKTDITGLLQIAHSSVRDYLLYMGPGNPPRYRFREIPAKAAVVRVCLGYIDSFLTQATPTDLETLRGSWLYDADHIWRFLIHEQKGRNQTRAGHITHEVTLNHDSSLEGRSIQEEAYGSILKFLVHNGSKLQQRTSVHLGEVYGGPPLYVASALGLTQIVEKLLSVGVSADEKGGIDGFAEAVALPNSFYKNTLDRFGIEEHEKIKYVQGSALGYRNALAASCYQGHASIVQMLLDSGAEVNGDGGTLHGSPLYAACHQKHKAVVEMLLKEGADVNQGGEKSKYPLSIACRSGSLEIVKLLLDEGADVNLGKPLSAACESGSLEIAKLLLDKGADITVGNPLFTACESGSFEFVKLLLDKGADVNTQGGHLGTALSMACSNRDESSVRILLANGADANAGGGLYGSPLQLACSLKGEQDAIVKMLLEHGADVNAKGGIYGTALHAAVEQSHKRSIKLLLDAGADIHIEAGEHGTILEAACFSKSEETFRLLLEAGADLNSPSPGRGKVLQLADPENQSHIVRYLVETGTGLADLDVLPRRERKYAFRIA